MACIEGDMMEKNVDLEKVIERFKETELKDMDEDARDVYINRLVYALLRA